MANFNQQMGYPNIGSMQRNTPIQDPYGNNNLIFNTPYNNYMGMNTAQQNNQNQYLKCRPVSSKDEARAFQIDLDGSLWVFTDVGNGKIYTKQINNDGTAAFRTYVLTKDEDMFSSSEYVTKEQFNNVIQGLVATIQQQQQNNVVQESYTNQQPVQNGKKEQVNDNSFKF